MLLAGGLRSAMFGRSTMPWASHTQTHRAKTVVSAESFRMPGGPRRRAEGAAIRDFTAASVPRT